MRHDTETFGRYRAKGADPDQDPRGDGALVRKSDPAGGDNENEQSRDCPLCEDTVGRLPSHLPECSNR